MHFRHLRATDLQAAAATASISFQALLPGGFLKVEPPVFSRIGCAVSRWLCTSFIRARIASGSAIVAAKASGSKNDRGSTPLLR